MKLPKFFIINYILSSSYSLRFTKTGDVLKRITEQLAHPTQTILHSMLSHPIAFTDA